MRNKAFKEHLKYLISNDQMKDVIPTLRQHFAVNKLTDRESNQHNYIFGRFATGRGILSPDCYIKNPSNNIMDDHLYNLKVTEMSPSKVVTELFKFLLKNIVDLEGEKFYNSGYGLALPHYPSVLQTSRIFRSLYNGLIEMASHADKKHLQIIIEFIPEALALVLNHLFYNQNHKKQKERILIIQIDNEYIDFSLVQLQLDNNKLEIVLESTDFIDSFGISHYDEFIFDYVLKTAGLTLDSLSSRDIARTRKKVIPEIIKCRKDLCNVEKSDIIVPNAVGAKHIDLEIESKELEDLLLPFNKVFKNIINEFLSIVLMKNERIDKVLINEKPQSIPGFMAIIQALFAGKNIEKFKHTDISKGASLFASHQMFQKYGYSKNKVIWDQIKLTY